MFRIPTVTCVALAVAVAMPAAAEEPQPVTGLSGDSGWEYTIAPYGFAASMNGTVGTFAGLPSANIDQSFSDLADSLRFAGMVAGTARKGRWGLSGDLQYYNLAPAFNTPGPLFDGGKLVARQTIFSAFGDYVLAETDHSSLIAMAGARFWSVDTSLQFYGAAAPGRQIDGSDNWVDPMIGLRGQFDLNDRWYVTGWGLGGGFGVGSDSAGDVFGAVGYRFNDRTAAVLGYRWMSVDRNTDDFVYDITMDGIMAGVSFGF